MNLWKSLKEENRFYLLGPTALLCAIAFSPLSLWVAIPGFFLSTFFRLRGFAYALVGLAIGAFVFHGFITTNHFIQAALEVSFAASFLIIALVQEEKADVGQTLQAQLEANHSTLKILEEELSRTKEEQNQTQIASDSKVLELQTRIEESEKDLSSLMVLNEVLRRTTGRHIEEKNELEKEGIDLQRKISLMREEIERLSQPLPPKENLMKELNAARVVCEQTHLINETLVKLHAQKWQEIEEMRSQMLPMGPSPVELKYNQLRKQFEEKNQILHETRKELFHKDTELQTLKLQQEIPVDPLIKPMQQEMEDLHQETSQLREENQELQDLISALIAQEPLAQKQQTPSKRKKKANKRACPELNLSLFSMT